MNRRNFIKSAAVASVAFPTIVSAIKPPLKKLDRVNIKGEFVDILSVDELKSHGIRSAIYSANCVDKYGHFGHESGFNPHRYYEKYYAPFIRQTHIITCLPQWWIGKYWHDLDGFEKNKEMVKNMIQEYRNGKILRKDGVLEYSLEWAIKEIKERMEYVCIFGYCHFDPVPEEAWPEKWMPVVGGLSKYRYDLYLKQLNGLERV